LPGVKRLGFADAQAVAERAPGDVRGGRVRRRGPVLRALQVGDLADPDAPADRPGGVRSGWPGRRRRGAVYEYEPEEGEILADLLPRNISVQVFRALLENGASEQGARMTAMDNATRNAGDMIKKLTLNYNRQRQAQITKELIEIISGAEAL
jgi:F-type H+-transporting ATPase subunit gamma